MIVGECDSCQSCPRVLRSYMSPHGEGSFCRVCFGDPLSEDLDEMETEIEILRQKPRDHETLARLAALELAYDEAKSADL